MSRHFMLWLTCLAPAVYVVTYAADCYSNISRGKRRKAQGEATTAIVESSEISPSKAKRAWARRSAELAEA